MEEVVKEEELVTSLVQQFLNAKVRESGPLPRDMALTVIFRVLYSPEAAKEGGIHQFLLSQSSLEDVFIALGD
jgi:hypothetical protein